MKFRAIEQSAQKFPDLLAPSGRPMGDEIASAKWLTWHGKSNEAVERLKRLHNMFDLPPAVVVESAGHASKKAKLTPAGKVFLEGRLVNE